MWNHFRVYLLAFWTVFKPCWMVIKAANKVCIWPMLSLSLSVKGQLQLLKKRVVEIHMVHYIILIICSQCTKTKKYGKVIGWKTICSFFWSCVNRNPPQLFTDKMTWGKMLSNYPNFWINCGQKKIHNIWTDHFLGFILCQTYKYIVNKMIHQYWRKDSRKYTHNIKMLQ